MRNSGKYIRVKEVSEYLDIPLKTVYRLVKQGKIKSIKIGGKIMCSFSDVERCYEHGTDLPSGDLRRSARINTNLSCRYSVALSPIKNITGEGMLANLSAGGIFIRGREEDMSEVGVDDPVDLRFLLTLREDGERVVEVKARVLRKTEKGVAVKFRDIDGDIKESIARYVG